MQVVEAEVPDVLVFEPKRFGDSRASFVENFHSERYAAAELPHAFVQDNRSRSSRGMLCGGLHLQNLRPQDKLVSVICGKVLDVAMDARVDNSAFARHVTMRASDRTLKPIGDRKTCRGYPDHHVRGHDRNNHGLCAEFHPEV